MRERIDFSSVSNILLENRKAEGISKSDYYHTLFEYAFYQEDVMITEPNDGDISKTLSGQRNVVKDIIYLYQTPGNRMHLQDGIENILEFINDIDYVKEQIYRLLWNDNTISNSKKTELSKSYHHALEFLTDCFFFVINRNFIPKTKRKEKLIKQEFLLSDYLLDYRVPSGTKVFYGREKELSDIHALLQKEHCLFLEGIGGIGKSELAKHYIKRYRKEYNHIVYLSYSDNLKQTIIELDFVDDHLEMDEEELFRTHYRFFKFLDSNSLVVLDNFNTVPEDEVLFHEFLSLSFQVLATTRSHIEEVPSYSVNEIENMDDLLHIFSSYASVNNNEISYATEIIEEVYRHTLTVELSAKTMTASGMDIKTLLTELRKDGISLSNPNKVSITKDFHTKKDRLFQHIQTLFQLQSLADTHLNILENMTLMPNMGIQKILFHNWLETADYNATNELIEYGWIKQNNEHNYIGLHPFLHEVILTVLQPSVTSCAILLKNIYANCICYGLDVPHYYDLLRTIESIFEAIEIDDSVSACLFMDSTMAYLGKYKGIEAIKKILHIMKNTIPLDQQHQRELAIYSLYSGYVNYMEENYTQAIKYYKQGLSALEPIHQEYAQLASNLYHNLGQVYFSLQDKVRFLEYVEKATCLQKDYNIPLSHDLLVQGISLAQALAYNGDTVQAKKILFRLIRETKKLENFDMSLAELYQYLGLIEYNQNPAEAERFLRKAKQYLLNHLPEEDTSVMQLENYIQLSQRRIDLLNKKGIFILPSLPFQKDNE